VAANTYPPREQPLVTGKCGGGMDVYRCEYRSVHGAPRRAFAEGDQHHFVVSIGALTNVSVILQFVSQVLPPSCE
jgi:hypothetical protein